MNKEAIRPMRATMVPIRLDAKTYKELKIRALIEKRPMADIIREAIALHFEMKPMNKKQFKTYLMEGLEENKAILKALARL